MSRVSLSRQQLSIAVLLESHAIACQQLFSIVVDAIKATNPENWKDLACSCFRLGVGRHLKKRLDDDLAVRDFYAVCKVFRSRLRDVAKLCGGELSDPHGRERLSLQIQGLETARHWLFHGEQYVSPREVSLSIALLITILESLPRQPRQSLSGFQRLSSLLRYAEKLSSLKSDCEYSICSAAVRTALLHSSLIELKQNFCAFLEQRKVTSNHPIKMKSHVCTKPPRDYPSLFSEIRKVSYELNKKEMFRAIFGEDQPKISLIDICKNVSELRNQAAHGEVLTLPATKSGVTQIRELLTAFHLNSEQATSAGKVLASLTGDEGDDIHIYCHERQLESCRTQLTRHEHVKRIFRPKGQHFIGRTQELAAIMSVLRSDQCDAADTCHPSIVICGPPGIGKSYLAVEAVHSLCETYKTQTWLSCSTSCHLEQDLSLSCNITPLPKASRKDSEISECDSDLLMASNTSHFKDNSSLVVFDDVRACTVSRVRKLITNSCSSVIITTTSPAVKLLFQNELFSLNVVQLKPFSVEDSKELVERKANLSGIAALTMASIERILCGALGNFPLSVNIYSSLLAVTLKKPKRTTFDVFDEGLIIKNWENIEEHYNDCLHVRGFSGVVQSAKCYLRKFPLVMFLLAKLCLVDSERVPWTILQNNTGVHQLTYQFPSEQLKQYILGLLGIMDWLFSEAGRTTLDLCRYELEELGLISWEQSTSTVHIHRLTLTSSQRLLEANNHFMGDLASIVPRLTRDEMIAGRSCSSGEKVSMLLKQEIYKSILDRCACILDEATQGSCENRLKTFRHSFPVFAILGRHMAYTKPLTCQPETEEKSIKLQHYIIFILFRYASHFEICWFEQKWPNAWLLKLKHMMSSHRSSNIANVYSAPSKGLQKLIYQSTGEQKYSAGLFKEAQESYESSLKMYKVDFGEQSVEVALTYCRIANCIGREAGQLARKSYLTTASEKCLRLKTLPNVQEMQEAVADEDTPDNKRQASQAANKLHLWSDVVLFRLEDAMEEERAVDAPTLEAAHFLMNFHRQEGQSAQERMNQGKSLPFESHWKVWQNSHLKQWLIATLREDAFRKGLRQYGHLVRMAVKRLPVIVSDVLPVITQSNRSWQPYDNCSLFLKEQQENWILSASIVGHFSLAEELNFKLVEGLPVAQTSPENGMQALLKNDKGRCDKKSMTSWEKESDLAREHAHRCKLAFQVSREIRLLHKTMDLEGSLWRFTTLFDDLVRQRFWDELGAIVLNYVVCLGQLLGAATGLKVLTTIKAWADDSSTCSSWKSSLQNASLELRIQAEQSELYAFTSKFLESRSALKIGDHDFARCLSLKCWKALVRLSSNSCSKSNELNLLFVSILLEMARNLQRCYEKHENIPLAEWFCSFRYQSARRAGRYFEATVHGMEYIEFLRKEGRPSEALELCQLVQNISVEQFGDDYAEWLPNTPQVDKIVQELTHNTDS